MIVMTLSVDAGWAGVVEAGRGVGRVTSTRGLGRAGMLAPHSTYGGSSSRAATATRHEGSTVSVTAIVSDARSAAKQRAATASSDTDNMTAGRTVRCRTIPFGSEGITGMATSGRVHPLRQRAG